MSIQLLPTSLLYQIIKSVPFPSRWETLLVCKSWHDICTDPYLYQEIDLEYMELKMLVKALQWIERQGTKTKVIPVRSLNIRHCYSDFLEETLVSLATTNAMIPLYSQLRTLTLDRRRMEYIKHDFRLYDILSDTLARLLSGTIKLARVEITYCDLDWAMTNLFTMLITFGAGRYLTTWIYHNNYTDDDTTATIIAGSSAGFTSDKPLAFSTSSAAIPTIPRSDLLQALIKACPNMKHFMGHHAAVNDALLLIMTRSWPRLESLVLLANDTTHSPISAKAFYSFISQCSSLHTLELYDMACMNQDDLIQMCRWKNNQASATHSLCHKQQRRHQPYYYHAKKPAALVGNALRHVKLTKYMTAPLSSQAILLHLIALFPHLRTLTYETNRSCFEIASQQQEKDQQWHTLVQQQQQLQQQHQHQQQQQQQQQQQRASSSSYCDFLFRLTCPPTMDQLLFLTSHQAMKTL